MATERKKLEFPNRRQFLRWGLLSGLGIGGSLWAWQETQRSLLLGKKVETLLPLSEENPSNPLGFLRHFDFFDI